MAMRDDVIPLGVPFIDTTGTTHESLRYVLSAFFDYEYRWT
jgi:hypothetical protein